MPIAKLRLSLGIAVICCALLAFIAPASMADVVAPPTLSIVDGNGVNLATGVFQMPGLNVGIGQGQSGLARQTQGLSDNFSMTGNYYSDASGLYLDLGYGGQIYRFRIATVVPSTSYLSGPYYTIGGVHATMTCVFVSSTPTACSLFLDDGTKVDYSHSIQLGGTLPWGGGTTITKADGEVISLTYYASQIRTVSSSLGWMLKYEVDANYNVTKVTALNTSVSYCDPNASSCSGLPSDTPYATQSTTSGVTTIARNGVTQVSYSVSGNVTTLSSPSGLTQTVTTASGKVSQVASGGQTWTYAYTTDADGNVTTTVTAPNNSTRKLTVTPFQQVLSQTDEAGRVTKYKYDPDGQLTHVISPDASYSGLTLTGGYTFYSYDSRGNVVGQTTYPKTGGTPLQSVTTYPSGTCASANTCNKPLTTTDTNGVKTTYTYDSAQGGNLLTVTLPVVNGVAPQTRYFYTQITPHVMNSSGVLVATAPVWRLLSTSTCMTLATCSDSSNPVDQLKTSYSYDTNHALPISTTVTHGNAVTSTVASLTTTQSVNNNGDVIVTDGPQAGAIDETYAFYDVLRRPVGAVSLDPDGTSALKRKASESTYDVDGRVTVSESGVAGTGLSAAYTGATALDRWTQAKSDWTTMTILQKDTVTYDTTSGLPIINRHYDGTTLTYLSQTKYDNMMRTDCVVQRMNPAVFGTVTGTNACALGTQGSDGPDRIVRYGYDILNNAVSTTTAYATGVAQVEVFKSYDNTSATSPGTLSFVEDAKGNRTSYSYDNFNRLIKTCYPSKTTIHASADTAPIDCAQVSYRTTTLAGVTQAGSLINTSTLRDSQVNTYAYDAIGRPSGRTGAMAESVVYDNFGQVTSHTQNGVSEAYVYDTAGWLLSDAQLPGTVTYLYDAYGRRSRLTYPGTGLYVTYAYNTGSYLTAIKENGSTNLATYAYDDYSRPTTVSFANGTSSAYSYDARSRLQALTNNLSYGASNAITLGYSQANQILSRVQSNGGFEKPSPVAGTKSLTHNGLNQMATNGTSILSYDNRGNLSSDGAITYTYDGNNNLYNLTNTTPAYILRYDAENRLRLIDSDSTSPRLFLYDGSDLIAEYGSGNVLVRRFVHGPDVDNPIVWYEGASSPTRYFFQADERGSITAMSDNSGYVKAVYSYDEYGLPKTNSGALSSVFGYTGQVYLPELGLYYYKARMYAPSLGRFMQTDPIGYGDGMNWYAYVHNDPINGKDPTGTECAPSGSSMSQSTGYDNVYVTVTGCNCSGIGVSCLSGSDAQDWVMRNQVNEVAMPEQPEIIVVVGRRKTPPLKNTKPIRQPQFDERWEGEDPYNYNENSHEENLCYEDYRDRMDQGLEADGAFDLYNRCMRSAFARRVARHHGGPLPKLFRREAHPPLFGIPGFFPEPIPAPIG